MASKNITNKIGDKDYQDIVNTIKKMIEAKRYACTLEQVLKDYRQMRHKKIDFGIYGYTSERDLLDKTNLFKFRTKDGKVYIELKSVKKNKIKTIKPSIKLSTIKKVVNDSTESSDTSRSESLLQANLYSKINKLTLHDKSSNIIDNYNEKLQNIEKKDEKLKSPDRDSLDTFIEEKDYNNETHLKLKKDKKVLPITNNSETLNSIKNELVSSKINPTQKLTKVQQAMQKMMRSRAGKEIKPISSQTISAIKQFVPMTAKEAYRHQLMEERQEMEKQINDIQRQKLANQDAKEQKLDTPIIVVPKEKEPEKEEFVYVPQYSGSRATPLTKLNIDGGNSYNIGVSSDKQNPQNELNFLELHVVNILHTKVSAYPNGFIAENMPAWYEGTFEKSLPTNWMNLVEKSKKFFIEKKEDNSLLYAIDKYNLSQKEKQSDDIKKENDDKVLNDWNEDNICV